MTDLERAPILRVMPGPGDINANGHIFGGWVLSQMDIAAGIVASRRAQGPGRDGGDRGDEVHRADPPARPDLGLCRGRAGRPHVDGRCGSRSIATATSARPRSRSPKACSPSSRWTRTTVRGRSTSTERLRPPARSRRRLRRARRAGAAARRARLFVELPRLPARRGRSPAEARRAEGCRRRR